MNQEADWPCHPSVISHAATSHTHHNAQHIQQRSQLNDQHHQHQQRGDQLVAHQHNSPLSDSSPITPLSDQHIASTGQAPISVTDTPTTTIEQNHHQHSLALNSQSERIHQLNQLFGANQSSLGANPFVHAAQGDSGTSGITQSPLSARAFTYPTASAFPLQSPLAAFNSSIFYGQCLGGGEEEPTSSTNDQSQELSQYPTNSSLEASQIQLSNLLNPIGSQASFTMPGYSNVAYVVPQPKRKTGGRRPKEEEEAYLDPSEAEKRRMRRQRNKEAAARCRQRRLDHMGCLQEQVNKLESENRVKEEEIERLRNEKAELERALRSHECKMGHNNGFVATPANKFMKKMVAAQRIKSERAAMEPTLTQIVTQSISSSMATSAGTISTSATPVDEVGLHRPTSLIFGGGPGSGVAITTPSSGLGGFDLLGASTGLTPVNNTGLTPILALGQAVTSSGLSLETPTCLMDTTTKTTICNL